MEEVSRIQKDIILPKQKSSKNEQVSFSSYIPALFAIIGSFLMVGLRVQIGSRFMSDEALMMIALACYILAALFQLTNLYAPSAMAQKIGLWGATLGVFFNFSSWLVRWVNAYEFELVQLQQSGNDAQPWIFRYIPFANLYDLSIAFAFGAGITTLLVAHRKNFQFLSAFTLPLAALILTLARFIGGEHSNLMPILDSYWRPIHVGVASLSYGVALVCFAVAVIYLLKDRVKVEGMAIWASVFALSVIATVSKFSVFTEFAYRAGTFINSPMSKKPFSGFFRFEIPYVGPTLVISGLLLVGVIVSFLLYLYQNNEAAKKAGHILLKLALVTQILAIAFLVSGIKSNADIYPQLQSQLASNPGQFAIVGRELNSKQDLSAQEFAALTPAQHEQAGRSFFQQNGSKLFLSLNTNPVEVAGLLTALAGIFFVMMFSFRTEKLIERLPSLDSLDSLMYKTACLAFAGLAMLLITGAIWANESWGRPWGFDSKETGALVAWLTYAAFLHTRISRGWKGRSSAYFAILGFLLVIFTYLGVSYLLPGLHSYA
ncbi:MAG TPA: cytochrome c biogenesis protein CcsA [Pyrinomonadaceae bacterium]|nr:cytochrome c biogenesis protein CcsA [Pyrinomonadaceae bacterium]